ncbi:hypothetical protein Pcinc_010708 [Petrolisthes cinctipes]|uniref:Uncharacterized protein n=1 Tax=Petrolisthes cinctipes TaxID=88211 RepID=A0AAE1KUA4_PETCI|nr:hypothetical protein Pcinc_010708 [Petrolisthes cinctipes]
MDEDGSDEEEDGFLDFETVDSVEESEDDGELVHDIRKKEDYVLEGGLGYYNKPEILKNCQEYEGVSDELPDEFSDSPSPVHKKKRRVMVEGVSGIYVAGTLCRGPGVDMYSFDLETGRHRVRVVSSFVNVRLG